MTWRKYLLIPRLVVTSIGAPRAPLRAWERYWSGVRRTGPDGDVLWDTGEPAEFDLVAGQLREHAETLPIVDLGCGSGRQARALARRDPAGPAVEFRTGDITEPGLGDRLAAELGEVNVHIRGVLHVLTDEQRRTVAETVAALVGRRGTLFLCETDQPGDPLDYLIAQGARPTHLPPALHRLIRSGVPAPRHFGPAELAAAFPPPRWRVLAEGAATMYGVPIRPGEGPQRIPSWFAVLRHG